MKRVVMIGAGLSGLVSARSFIAAMKAKGEEASVTVIEALPRAGGNLMSERHEGFLIDGGPDSWVAAKPHGVALCRELGLGDALIETLPANRRVYVAHQGGLVPMPEGVVLGTPTRLRPMATTKLLSWRGKLRALFDLVLPETEIPEDVSLGELVAARIGREAVTALVEPLLAGIYAGDAWTLSARATFPQLVEMLRSERSLLRAARAAAPKRHGGYVPPSAFVSLRGGVGQLVDALVASLPAGTVRLSTRATAVRAGSASRWEVALEGGEVLAADHVVLGLAPHFAAKLARDAAPTLADALEAVPCTSAATVFFAHERRSIPHPLDATGFIVPKREGMRILAGTWVSSKWPGRAPEGKVLMRAFLGGVGREEALTRPDDELVSEARIDVERLMKFRAEPLFTRVFRFTRTSPLPTVGHIARIARIRAAAAQAPGLHPIGSAYDGVGIPDTIRLADATGRSLAGG
jgi:oxygen-dependent protoporphyrinogen oxidase